MEIKISRRRKAPRPRAKWDAIKTMKEGESFFVPSKPPSNILRYYSRVYGGRFTQRQVVEKQVKGYRVWCLEPCRNGKKEAK